MNRIIDFIIENNKWVIGIIILITIPLAYYSNTRQEFNNSLFIFFDKDDPDIKVYRDLQEMYGNDQFAAIIFKDENIFSNEIITIIRKISELAKETKGIQRVLSITEQKEAVTVDDSLYFKKIIPDGILGEEALKTIKKRALNSRLLQSLISKDGSTTVIMMEIDPVLNTKQQMELLANIKKSFNHIAEDRVDLHFSSGPYIEAELNTLAEKDSLLIPMLCGLMISIIALLMLRNISLTLLCLVDLFITLVLSIGLYFLWGETLNMVTVMMPGVLLAIAVADSIHLLAHYKDEHARNGNDHIGAVSRATKAIWIPCLFTSLTTAVGFFSFVTSTIRPTRVLGVFTAAGVMIACIMTVTFLPAALVFLKKRFEKENFTKKDQQKILTSVAHKKELGSKLLWQIGNFSTSHSKTICVAFMFISILAVFGISKLRYSMDLMEFLPDNNVIKSDLKFVEKNLGGVFANDFLIQAKSQEFDFTHPQSLQLIDEIEKDFKRIYPNLTSSFSIAYFFKEINMAFNDGKEEYYKIPENRTDILDFYELGDSEDMERVISSDRMETRISWLGYSELAEEKKQYNQQANTYLKKKLGKNYEYKQTGMGMLSLVVEDKLSISLIRSFVFAFGLIFLMMLYICKNVKLAIISMVPNLFPIFLTLGVMGLLDIPINVVTVMIASVTLGIAVDDTIHYLVWYRRNLSSGMDVKTSLIKAHQIVGKPIVITSIILFMGFFILILSSLKVVGTFGIITAFAVFAALIGDLLLFPALILIFNRPKKVLVRTPAKDSIEPLKQFQRPNI